MKVAGGVADTVELAFEKPFTWLDTKGSDLSLVEKTESARGGTGSSGAGQKAGEAVYRLNGETLGTVNVVYVESVAAAGFGTI